MAKQAWIVVFGVIVVSAGCGGDDTFVPGGRVDDDVGGGSANLECGDFDDTNTGLDAEEQAFLDLLNQHRASNGAPPVTACTSMNRAAQAHSEDMRDEDYFDHTGLNGSSPSSRACEACYESCQSVGFGENIAAGNSGAEGTFQQWVTSEGHNANMLRAQYEVVGIGRATGGGRYGSYWTNVFATASDASCN
ncbi:MAG: CAP domain-containing protein [Myxococcota bacterium]